MRRTLWIGPVLGVALAVALAGCGSASPASQGSRATAGPSLSLRATEAPVTTSSAPPPAAVPTTAAPPTTAPARPAAPPPAPVRGTPPPAPAPKSSAPAPKPPPPPPSPAPAGCHPLTDGGKCYEPGEFCRDSDHGVTGLAGDGKVIKCEDNDGWRWEPQ